MASSLVPRHALNHARHISTAAALVIGDEILNGKTLDRNSNYFARFCFQHGIDLYRSSPTTKALCASLPGASCCLTPPSIDASRRLVAEHDFVVTSGGIGPTHDDITYASLAKAFHQKLAYHSETLTRMEALMKHRPPTAFQTQAQRTARMRMALLPEHAEVLFVASDLWVPVVRLQAKLCVLPGIPTLFQRLLDGLQPFLALPPLDARPCRIQVFTTHQESTIAPYLAELQAHVSKEGIQIGSYPALGRGVRVSLIGTDRERIAKLADEVRSEIKGRILSEGEGIGECGGGAK